MKNIPHSTLGEILVYHGRMMGRNDQKTNKELREGKAGGTLVAFGAYVLVIFRTAGPSFP